MKAATGTKDKKTAWASNIIFSKSLSELYIFTFLWNAYLGLLVGLVGGSQYHLLLCFPTLHRGDPLSIWWLRWRILLGPQICNACIQHAQTWVQVWSLHGEHSRMFRIGGNSHEDVFNFMHWHALQHWEPQILDPANSRSVDIHICFRHISFWLGGCQR